MTTITVTGELERILIERAKINGTTPEAEAIEQLNARFLPPPELPEPRDEWERQLRSVATNCRTSLSNHDVSSEGIYD